MTHPIFTANRKTIRKSKKSRKDARRKPRSFSCVKFNPDPDGWGCAQGLEVRLHFLLILRELYGRIHPVWIREDSRLLAFRQPELRFALRYSFGNPISLFRNSRMLSGALPQQLPTIRFQYPEAPAIR